MIDVQKTRELQGKIEGYCCWSFDTHGEIGDELDLFEKLYNIGPCTYSRI